MQTKRLNLVDTAWLNVESADAPMQVGGLLTFRMPDDAPADLPKRIVDHYKRYTQACSPWNHRLRKSALRTVAPEWELLDEIDVDYHFRHSALPAPGDDHELAALASRLHSHPLDFRHPPWECHLIEGLTGNRFALYIKLHHSLIDGVAGMRLLARALTDDPNDRERLPFWAIEKKKRSRSNKPSRPRPGLGQAVAQLVDGAREQVNSLSGFSGMVRDMLRTARAGGNPQGLPFASGASVINTRIRAQRRYATQLYSLSEFQQLAERADCTVNDLVLTVCGGALRHYLTDIGELPRKPLTAGIPVSVRPADDEVDGNALTFMVATLGTDIADTRERLAAISASTRRAKENLRNLTAAGITQYTVALMAPFVLSLLTGMSGRTRPVFNVTVSNLPGPAGPLYIFGAEMEAFYPTSLVTHGQALNITVHGYADTLGFGFIGCRNTLPSLERIAAYAGDTLDELRNLYGDAGAKQGKTSEQSAPKRKTASRRKSE